MPDAKEVKTLSAAAKNLGLEVLLELHAEEELDHICDTVDMVGVNNRNLKNFEVDLEHSVRLAQKIDDRFVKVAESGINDIKNIQYLKQHGFQGFLIGEYFMKQQSPMQAFRDLQLSYDSTRLHITFNAFRRQSFSHRSICCAVCDCFCSFYSPIKSNPMKVKVCGITQMDQLRALAEMNVDYAALSSTRQVPATC
jgi:hypothetical protein